MRRALRLAAIAIAVAGIVDPAFTREIAVPQPVTIAATSPEALGAAHALQMRIGDEEAHVRLHAATSQAAACPADGACIVVSSGEVPSRLTAGATVVGALHVPPDRIIRRVEGPARAHLRAPASLKVALARPAARIDVFDGEVLVGTAETNGSSEAEVTWVPVATGPRRLRVVVDGDAADAGVLVVDEPWPVAMYEPQPTWLGTFVRRALEGDPRLDLVGSTRVAPPVSVTRGASARLGADTVGRVVAVIVTAPERLTAPEVDLLERFVRVRGGSLVLLPDHRPSGPVLRLLPPIAGERRARDVQPVGPLRARELLRFERAAGLVSLADVGSEPAIVARALGNGRLIASGALDAWRYRDERFAPFWSALIVDAAQAAGWPLQLDADEGLAAAGEAVTVRAAYRTLDGTPQALSVEGGFACGDERGMLRFWPAGRPGVFEASFRAAEPGACEVSATIGDRTAKTAVLVVPERTRAPREGQLDAVVRAHGGIVVEPGDEATLIDRLERLKTSRVVAAAWHPMRSALWLLPFAACLGGEWWLRRRSGLR